MENKKIAVIYSGAKHWGGIETYLELLFASIDKSKFDLALISLGDWKLTDKLRVSGFVVQILPKSRVNPGTILSISKFLTGRWQIFMLGWHRYTRVFRVWSQSTQTLITTIQICLFAHSTGL
jgi:hypothetical protein